MKCGIITAADESLDWNSYLTGVEIVRHPANVTTKFENVYQGGKRIQRLLATSGKIPVTSVPPEWIGSTIVHLAPVVHEITGEFSELFPRSLVGITPQGLLRDWDPSGLVYQSHWKGDDSLLSRSQIAIFSKDDISNDPTFLCRCLEQIPIVVVTEGERGAILYHQGKCSRFPAYPAQEVDPTGAGDVFAASFLVEYHLTGDPHRSAAFACCAASFAVERAGLEGITSRDAIEDRLAQYRSLL